MMPIRSDFSLDCHGRGPAWRRVAASLLALATCRPPLGAYYHLTANSVLEAAGETVKVQS